MCGCHERTYLDALLAVHVGKRLLQILFLHNFDRRRRRDCARRIALRALLVAAARAVRVCPRVTILALRLQVAVCDRERGEREREREEERGRERESVCVCMCVCVESNRVHYTHTHTHTHYLSGSAVYRALMAAVASACTASRSS